MMHTAFAKTVLVVNKDSSAYAFNTHDLLQIASEWRIPNLCLTLAIFSCFSAGLSAFSAGSRSGKSKA